MPQTSPMKWSILSLMMSGTMLTTKTKIKHQVLKSKNKSFSPMKNLKWSW